MTLFKAILGIFLLNLVNFAYADCPPLQNCDWNFKLEVIDLVNGTPTPVASVTYTTKLWSSNSTFMQLGLDTPFSITDPTSTATLLQDLKNTQFYWGVTSTVPTNFSGSGSPTLTFRVNTVVSDPKECTAYGCLVIPLLSVPLPKGLKLQVYSKSFVEYSDGNSSYGSSVDMSLDISANFNPSNSSYQLTLDSITFTTTPVPEPETYAMMLAGLGLLNFVVRRRKIKQG